jgi:bacillithiol system protein YtxJ
MKEIREGHDLEQLLNKSATAPVMIFKHSTQCSVSAGAYEDFAAFIEGTPTLDYGIVCVIESRAISDEIEERFGVRHESPQALLIKDGRVLWHASHWRITPESLKEALSHAESAHQRN